MKDYDYPISTPAGSSGRSLRVRLLSDANIAVTTAVLPSGQTKTADATGTVSLGVIPKGATVYITTEVRNPAPEEDEIKLAFDLDGAEMLVHSNPKSVAADVSINIDLTFS
ncbi:MULTISPECIES: hypothetical protein [unclassified Flavobacterium]|uniref:hypothetical protein n=1 Tax=unclassified Flavobacterium TaxID=196869 RepID=UPI001F148B43|nr:MULTISPECIES: hypothetical protein [unclassified Flavobacterium]UMY66862.1 hypothetical protein MKO97_05630 [Flavobacterium sp. HJ-32-4]